MITYTDVDDEKLSVESYLRKGNDDPSTSYVIFCCPTHTAALSRAQVADLRDDLTKLLEA